MDDLFHRLIVRAERLGNCARKYTRAVERNGDRLLARLEETGRLSRVHVDRVAPSLADDMDQVAAVSRDPEERLQLLGTFYAIQYLHLNARALERLAVDLAENPLRMASYSDFLRRAEADFSALIGAYVRRVLRVVLPGRGAGPYLLCSVGTRGHQDDLDVAVLDGGGPERPAIDRAFARLSVQMLRHASALDHYLASRVGALGLTLSIEELRAALRRERLDFVVVTELLRAEPVAGSRDLYRRLREEVVAEFHFRPGQDNRLHEFYLRGLLGEVRSLLLRPSPPGSINAKDDALRLIVGLTMALKTSERLDAARTHEILRQLRGRRPALRPLLASLEGSLIFLETFHHLSYLFIAEEEDVLVEGDAARANLRLVADAMGYHDQGPVNAVDHMLVHYQEAVAAVRGVAIELMEEAARHLKERSRYSCWPKGELPEPGTANYARELVAGGRGFRGARFWDDQLEALAAPDQRLLHRLAEDISTLPVEERQILAGEYAEWGRDAPYALLTILSLLARRSRGAHETEDPAQELTSVYLNRVGSEAEDIRALSRVFRFYPALVNRFLLTLDRDQLDLLRSKLGVSIGNPEVAAARERFRAFIRVHRRTSRYVKRVLGRVTERFPATVLALPDDHALHTLAQGRLAAGERHPNPETQKGLLGDFYDMEFLRIAVGTLQGAPILETRTEFVELTETYLRDLFDVCVREAERERGAQILQRDLLGIFLAGGHSRSRPFDEDYDFLVLLDSDDPEDRQVAERAIVLMNRQIARRGVVAQYRLGERFGRFCTTFQELEGLFRQPLQDLFVDLHQLVGARLVVGSRRIDQALVKRILEPEAFGTAGLFTMLLGREITERRARMVPRPEGTLHIKNMRGGLREIDLCLAVLRSRLSVRDPDTIDPFATLAALDSPRAHDYRILAAADTFLVAVRSAYRVTVAATDVVERDFLDRPARTLGYVPDSGHSAAALLFSDIERHSLRAAAAIDRLLGL